MKYIACSCVLWAAACSGGGSFIPLRDMAMQQQNPDGGPCTCPVDTTCINGSCVSCGKNNQPCCGGTACTDGSACSNGTCVMGQNCGQLGQPCCNGTNCAQGSCTNGTCTMMQNCGTLGLPCCNGTTCNDGSVCTNGTCAAAMKQPVGHTCTAAGDCGGTNPKCVTTLGTIPAPGGYCENTPCANDNDCGGLGFCATMSNLCLGACMGKGTCQQVNPNNRCFFWSDGSSSGACLPSALSTCNPTQNGTCNNTNLCGRSGFDDVGSCYTACTFGAACPNDAQGNPQGCYYVNDRVDVNGNPTSDLAQGLACLFRANTLGINQACDFINDCAMGYECDFYLKSGAKVCKQMCRKANGNADCTQGGTCQDAFKVGVNFTIGLCI